MWNTFTDDSRFERSLWNDLSLTHTHIHRQATFSAAKSLVAVRSPSASAAVAAAGGGLAHCGFQTLVGQSAKQAVRLAAVCPVCLCLSRPMGRAMISDL